jgi:Uma2 family endonuclease
MADVPLIEEVTTTAEITLEDLMRLGKRVEIIEGEIVEMVAAGIAHLIIGNNIYDVVKPFAVANDLGPVFSDGLTYLMFAEAKRLKDSFVPDVSHIRKQNLLPNIDISKPYPGIPDWAVEVVSPGDDADKIQTKLATYLAKGTEQVWIVYPSTREVYQYRRDHNPYIRIYSGSAKLDVEALFPGLELTTDMIFALPPWALQED